MPNGIPISHYAILASMVAPALLITATSSLLISANNRLARVVDRLRALIDFWEQDATDREERDQQILRHRQRAHMVLRACALLYLALGAFVGTSLTLAIDAFAGFRMGAVPTVLAVFGVLLLLGGSLMLWREVNLAVSTFDLELDVDIARIRAKSMPAE